MASDLTDHGVGDVTDLPDLLDQVDGRIDQFLGDGAYDGDLDGRALGLPRWKIRSVSAAFVQTIRDKGRTAWQKASG